MRLRYHTLVSLTSKDQNSIPIPTEAMDAFIKVLFDLLVKDSIPCRSSRRSRTSGGIEPPTPFLTNRSNKIHFSPHSLSRFQLSRPSVPWLIQASNFKTQVSCATQRYILNIDHLIPFVNKKKAPQRFFF